MNWKDAIKQLGALLGALPLLLKPKKMLPDKKNEYDQKKNDSPPEKDKP